MRNIAPAYRMRCDGFNNWYFRNGDEWTVDKRLKFLSLALADAERNIELHKGKMPRDAYLANIVVLNNLGYVSKLEKYNLTALEHGQQDSEREGPAEQRTGHGPELQGRRPVESGPKPKRPG